MDGVGQGRRQRRGVVLIALLALLVLVLGAVGVVYQCLTFSDGESWGLAIGPGWSLVMLVVWLLLSIALMASQRWWSILGWLGACLLSAWGLWTYDSLVATYLGPNVRIIVEVATLAAALVFIGDWLVFRPD